MPVFFAQVKHPDQRFTMDTTLTWSRTVGPRPPLQQYPCWRVRRSSTWRSSAKSCSPRHSRTVQPNQQELPRPRQVCCGGYRQDPDSRPRRSPSSPTRSGAHWSHFLAHEAATVIQTVVFVRICSAQAWHLSLIGFTCASAFPSLPSYTQGQCFFRNYYRSTYTTTEQILHRWGRLIQVHTQPPRFNAAVVPSVATVVLWDCYACELCDAPAQPTRCPLRPRELCSALL